MRITIQTRAQHKPGTRAKTCYGARATISSSPPCMAAKSLPCQGPRAERIQSRYITPVTSGSPVGKSQNGYLTPARGSQNGEKFSSPTKFPQKMAFIKHLTEEPLFQTPRLRPQEAESLTTPFLETTAGHTTAFPDSPAMHANRRHSIREPPDERLVGSSKQPPFSSCGCEISLPVSLPRLPIILG